MKVVPQDTVFDMTDVMTKAIDGGSQVSVFPIHEYWADIGSPSDLKQVLKEFSELTTS